MRHLVLLPATLLFAALTACGKGGGGSASCGIAALTGPYAVREGFQNGNLLTVLPETVPTGLVFRLVAGPALRSAVTRNDSGWVVTMKNPIPPNSRPGYGVLVVDEHVVPLGVLMFEGPAIPGAPHLGSVALRDTVVPLLAVRVTAASIQDAACPLFPDSLR